MKFNGGATGDSGTGTARLQGNVLFNGAVVQNTPIPECSYDPMGEDVDVGIPMVAGFDNTQTPAARYYGYLAMVVTSDGVRKLQLFPRQGAGDPVMEWTIPEDSQGARFETSSDLGVPTLVDNDGHCSLTIPNTVIPDTSAGFPAYLQLYLDSESKPSVRSSHPVVAYDPEQEDDVVVPTLNITSQQSLSDGQNTTFGYILPNHIDDTFPIINKTGMSLLTLYQSVTQALHGGICKSLVLTENPGTVNNRYVLVQSVSSGMYPTFYFLGAGSAGASICALAPVTGSTGVVNATWTATPIGGGSSTTVQQLRALLDNEAPIQLKYDDDTSPTKVVVYQDPVEASPLSRIDTPSPDVISDNISISGGGYGNDWSSCEGHLFTVPNYLVPDDRTSKLGCLVLSPNQQTTTLYVAIYEYDDDNKQLHLVCKTGNMCTSSGITSTGHIQSTATYVDPTYNMIKPGKLYYAITFCDQSAVQFGGLACNTFNLNPSSSVALGINKQGIPNTDLANVTSAIQTFDYTQFGMSSYRLYNSLIR